MFKYTVSCVAYVLGCSTCN